MSFLTPKKRHGPSKAHLVIPFPPRSPVDATLRTVPVCGAWLSSAGCRDPLFLKPRQFGRKQTHACSHAGSYPGQGLGRARIRA